MSLAKIAAAVVGLILCAVIVFKVVVFVVDITLFLLPFAVIVVIGYFAYRWYKKQKQKTK